MNEGYITAHRISSRTYSPRTVPNPSRQRLGESHLEVADAANPQMQEGGTVKMAIPTRVADRLSNGIKRFQPILLAAKSRDVNESDTSMIATDMLADLFGYDKYSEVTRELCIRGTFCDLATRIDGKFQMIIEVKAIGIELKDHHVKQAVDYAANQGIEWVALTSGNIWKVYRVFFTKPIGTELVLDIDLLSINHKNSDHLENLFLLTRESMIKSGLYAYHDQLQATNKFFLGAVLLSDPVLETMRREIRRLSPEVRIQVEDLREMLNQEVLKREVIEGEKAETAKRKVQKAASKLLRVRKGKEEPEAPDAPPAAQSKEGQIIPAKGPVGTA
jgi:hypothetical protein